LRRFRCLSLVLLLLPVVSARATDFIVNQLADHADGQCNASDCTLREAINGANAAAGPNRIILGVGGTIQLGSGLPAVTRDVPIFGNGVVVRHNTGGGYRILKINAGVTVTIDSMDFNDGRAPTGAAILNAGTLTLSFCGFHGNKATGNGGAIQNDGGLLIDHCLFDGNSADNYGGAIINDNSGSIMMRDTTVSASTAASGGGAIINFHSLMIERSTLSGNHATSGVGGAIYNGHSLTLESSTLTDNEAAGGGGALGDNSGNETFQISHCTIVRNRSSGGGGGFDFFGTTSATVDHTIIAGNTANGNLRNYADSAGVPPLVSHGYNLSDDAPSGFGATGDQVNVPDAKVDVLADNGGSTATMALLDGSPALNHGDPAFAPPPDTDQRGLKRVSGGRIDIGAVEMDLPQRGHKFVVNLQADSLDGACTDNVCSLRDAVEASNAVAGPNTISIPLESVVLAGALPDLTRNVTIQGTNPAGLTTIDAAGLCRHFVVFNGKTVLLSRLRLINGHRADNGGSIANDGTLTLTNCALTGNSAQYGAAIQNGGTLTVNSSTLNGNTASNYGGAIFNAHALTLNSSTLTDNQAGLGGGALSDNSGGETFVINHCTIAGNRVPNAGAGGGIDCINQSSVTLSHTILAGNTAHGALHNYATAGGTPPPIVSHGYNLSDGAPSGFTGTGDQVNSTNVKLEALADNGGPTKTMALLKGSAAINTGDPAFAPPPKADQRGAGFPRVVGGRIDIGAFEYARASIGFSAANYSAVESTHHMIFTVTRSGDRSAAASAICSTSDGTAVAGPDYTAKNALMSFAAGETTKTFDVFIGTDDIAEGPETFHVGLHSASGATLRQPFNATGTIQDQ
jgi:CSLREA domain-containing protein